MFVGPGAERGTFKAKPNALGIVDKLELVVNPELSWPREPMAIGAAMAYKRLQFTDEGALVFLTKNNGIGILRKDGKVAFLDL